MSGRRAPARRISVVVAILLAAAPAGLAAQGGEDAASHGSRPSAAVAAGAFQRLKGLAGDHAVVSSDSATGSILYERANLEYRLTSAGSVLLERANIGSTDEMLSLFYMDGDRLVLQHYCSAGNQPRLELVDATADQLVFDFAGGHNLDPSVDGHIHRVRFAFGADGNVESYWSWFENGAQRGVNRRVQHSAGGRSRDRP